MRKFINRLLHDKDDFHKDDDLKQRIELHNYLLEQIIDLEQYIIPAKIRYFWRNKKAFLFRLFIKIIIALATLAGIGIVGWFFGFKYNPKPVVIPRYVVLYVTEGTDTVYIKSHLPKARFVLLYPPDPSKDWNRYKEEMHSRFESPGTDSASYHARRWNVDKKTGAKSLSEYWGRYQLGDGARKRIGLGNVPWDEFESNPEMQEGAFKAWIRVIYRDMMPYIDKYSGRFIAGHQITASGIIAMAHNVGEAPTITFLSTNGGSIPADGNAPATRFLSLGGYDLTSLIE